MSKVKVLYILGWGRSGSTILANLLGEVSGFFSVGELRHLWEKGMIGGSLCGCGKPVTTCEVWSAILKRLSDARGGVEVNPDELVESQRRLLRIRHTWSLIRHRPGSLEQDSELAKYVELQQGLYSSIARVSGDSVIVESSKRPSSAALLHLMPQVDPYLVHLVRDPRAVAYSWSKRSGMGRHGVINSTLNWVVWNLGGETIRKRNLVDHSLVLRYEDFVREPRRTLGRIVRMVGEAPDAWPVSDDGWAELGVHHTVAGNRGRFKTGRVQLRLDDEWLTGLQLPTWLSATVVSLPLLHRYNYRILEGAPMG